jgi:putative addiction module component (TIGR02574 family)
MTADQIIKAALELPEDERVRVADELMASLDPEEQRRIDEAWAVEIERRIDELDAGKVQGRPAADVMRELREKYL